ncbi:unnamed protein product [Caenorhabditis angaria]|uniref:Uncharacterized protein n=1 Tax=Caenorhabditis angaria TaxID=860376 RepID=A0A9P1IKP4_9PELO|nr:unnamed protein product [Caenorhabditis angaria]
MIISSFLVFIVFLVANVRSHCPHMMGVKVGPPAGPSPPGNLPEGDQGWDWDEAGAAPGILPEPHFIQSTYVYRSHNELEKTFSNRVIQVLRQIRERLGKSARLTLENENIECNSQSDHFRCQEFPNSGSWNYFLVEDAKNGAVVYNFERKNNEKNDGTIEMAILDALSRHSPNSLIAFASPEAEKEVGYIRALSSKELESLSSPPKIPLSLEKFGPNELNLIEPALLEVRTGANLKTDSEVLRKLKNSAEFDEVLEKFEHVFVLFWNKSEFFRVTAAHDRNAFNEIKI